MTASSPLRSRTPRRVTSRTTLRRPRPRTVAARRRDERGVAFPSPVVMLSIIAVAMAGFAFVATSDEEPTERRITTTAAPASETAAPEVTPTTPTTPTPTKKPKPQVKRGEVYVEVYNNSGIKGLAAASAAKATQVGWQVVGEDNWQGVIPASTVYYPARLQAAAKLLALDLGIARTAPAVEPMRMDRLTVILTADAA
jgi:LytR cell envelope-related transcriptional attenuator